MDDLPDLELVKVTDRVYSLPCWEQNDWCTLGLVVGDRHTMMLDAGTGPRQARMFLEKIRQRGLPRPDMCALTHWHWDHTYGLAWLGDLISFTTSKTNRLLKNMQGWGWSDREMKKRLDIGEDLAFSYPHINDEYPDKSLIKIACADVEYRDRLKVDLGGVSVVMQTVENSHSDDCAVFYIPEEKCIFVGDTCYEDLLPNQPVYYEDSHHKMVNSLRKFKFDKVIAGHQPVMTSDELYVQLAGVETVKRD